MDAENESSERQNGAAPDGSCPVVVKKYQPFPAMAWDILSLLLAFATLGGIVGLLIDVNGSTIPYDNIDPRLIVLALLLLPLYVFTMIQAAHSVGRIMRLHSGPFDRGSVNGATPRPRRLLLSAVRIIFTHRLLGIASAPVLLLLLAMMMIPAPLSIDLFFNGNIKKPLTSYYGAHPQLAVARDINTRRYGHIATQAHGIMVHTALNRALGLSWQPIYSSIYRSLQPTPDFRCPTMYHDEWQGCDWSRYATIAIRSQCRESSERVDVADYDDIWRGLRNVSALPRYDPLDESRASDSSTPILSFKDNTLITLSNLESHTGPWTSDTECSLDNPSGCQISKEALHELERFTSVVVNPVHPTAEEDPAFNQTAGTLLNFHVIYAELGISGAYDDQGNLTRVGLRNEAIGAWECSLDVVLQEMQASLASYWGSRLTETKWSPRGKRDMLLPLNPSRVGDTIDFLWNDTRYTIERNVTDSMTEHLRTFFAGSSVGAGWMTRNDLGTPSFHSTSAVVNTIHKVLANYVDTRRKSGRGGAFYWSGYTSDMFEKAADSLSFLVRHYGSYCDRWSPPCSNDYTLGVTYQSLKHRYVKWKYLCYPCLIVAIPLLLVIIAAGDEWYHRIRLPDDPTEAAGGDGIIAMNTPRLEAEEDRDAVDADPLNTREGS